MRTNTQLVKSSVTILGEITAARFHKNILSHDPGITAVISDHDTAVVWINKLCVYVVGGRMRGVAVKLVSFRTYVKLKITKKVTLSVVTYFLCLCTLSLVLYRRELRPCISTQTVFSRGIKQEHKPSSDLI